MKRRSFLASIGGAVLAAAAGVVGIRSVSKTQITRIPDDFLPDFKGLQSYIDRRLPYLVDAEAERLILYGDGLSPKLKRLLRSA